MAALQVLYQQLPYQHNRFSINSYHAGTSDACFVCFESHVQIFLAIWRLSPLPVTGLQI
jgi:hypothetical protein